MVDASASTGGVGNNLNTAGVQTLMQKVGIGGSAAGGRNSNAENNNLFSSLIAKPADPNAGVSGSYAGTTNGGDPGMIYQSGYDMLMYQTGSSQKRVVFGKKPLHSQLTMQHQ